MAIEIHNDCSKRKRVEAHTHESSPEIVPECLGRKSAIIPGGKRQIQPLISDVAKKMRMSSNLAKRKRPEDETAHPEDDWHGEVYSNASSYVLYDKFGQGVIATFSKGPVSSVLKGGHIASNSNVLCKVKPLSCFDDISGSTEIAQCEKGLETNKTTGVEISGTSQIVGKNLNLHIAELSAPAGTLALKYVDAEVSQNCNKQ